MYKFLIKKEDEKWFFGLYPNNSNTQPIGISKLYYSKKMCENGLKNFKLIISKMNFDDLLKKVNIVNENQKFLYQIIYNKEIIFHRNLPVESENQIFENINQIKKYINSELK